MLTWLTEPLPSRSLGLARLVVGVAAMIKAALALPILLALTDPMTMRAPYLPLLPRPSEALVLALVAIWLLSALGFTLGWRVSLTGSLLCLAVALTLALDQQTYSNHLYLMAWLTFLLIVADAGAGLAIGSDDRAVVRWPVLLLCAQASIVYGFSGLTKLNPQFLSGAVLNGVMRGGVVPVPDAVRNPDFLAPLAAVVVAVELFLAIMLWSPRLRRVAYVVGVGLHLSITVLMPQTLELLVFSMEMLAIYPLFALVISRVHQDAKGAGVSSPGSP